MPNYRRPDAPGALYFVTMVTHQRRSHLAGSSRTKLFRSQLTNLMRQHRLQVPAIVVLPDHVHLLLQLPPNDSRLGKYIGELKVGFSRMIAPEINPAEPRPLSRTRHRELLVWQRRFWEHQIRADRDFEAHVNYIHYNPVKHGHATCPHDYPASSFRRWCEKEWLRPDWGCVCSTHQPSQPFTIPLLTTTGE